MNGEKEALNAFAEVMHFVGIGMHGVSPERMPQRAPTVDLEGPVLCCLFVCIASHGAGGAFLFKKGIVNKKL